MEDITFCNSYNELRNYLNAIFDCDASKCIVFRDSVLNTTKSAVTDTRPTVTVIATR